jgi:glycosyltransferase involved in cell wall biosynthesis
MGFAISCRRIGGVYNMVERYRPKVLIIGGPDVDARIPLIKQMEGDFHFMVAGSHDQPAEPFQKAGLEFWSYPMHRSANPVADLKMLVSLIRLIRLVNVDIVHTFDTKPSVWGRLAARMANVPVVVGTLPGLGSLYSHNTLGTRLIRSIYQPVQKLACHQSDLTIFQNSADAAHFIQAGIVQNPRAAILPGSGVETQYFDPDKFKNGRRKQLRTELGLNDVDITITMISRLIRSKGILEFSQVAQMVYEQHPETKFLLVGPNDLQSVDTLTAKEMKQVKQSVICLGARKDVPKLLSISDLFAFPTYYHEGIPRVLLEAASMGLPIVATHSPGCEEVVEHNVNGFLVPKQDTKAFSNAVSTLIVNPSLRRRFGDVSRQRAVHKFDLSIIAEKTTSIYQQLLEAKSNGRKKTHSRSL